MTSVTTRERRYLFEPEPVPALPMRGSDKLFPVHRIYCVGRNYAEHAREMGHDPNREPPFFFQKNPDSLIPGNGDFPYPSRSTDVHHEFELVLALGRGGSDIPVERALDCVYGYAVGLDMTRRDLQIKLRDRGRPWELSKAFDQSAPIAAVVPAATIGHPTQGAIWVKVDGSDRQRSDIAKLIWSVPEVVANLSLYFELRPGDLIFTGTPDGVGPVERGQTLHGGIDGLGELKVRVA